MSTTLTEREYRIGADLCDRIFFGRGENLAEPVDISRQIRGAVENYLETRGERSPATAGPAPADQDAKYEAEYLKEKAAFDQFGISKEVAIYTLKTNDGVDCEWPGDANVANEEDAVPTAALASTPIAPGDEKYHRMFELEKLACENAGLSRESFVSAMKWADGVPE